jgi:hypothetical protein
LIPSPEKLRARAALMQMQAAAMMQDPAAPGQQTMPGQGQTLANGAPVTDNFAPMRQ